MKRFLSFALVLGIVLAFSGLAVAQNVDDLKSSLEQSGQFTSQEVQDIEKELQKLLDAGASNDEVQTMLVDLKQQGAGTEELKAVLKQTQKMINKGVQPQEAITTVSTLAGQSMQQGLQGKDFEKQLKEAVKMQEKQDKGGMSDTMGGGEMQGQGSEQPQGGDTGGTMGTEGGDTGTMGTEGGDTGTMGGGTTY
jgi:hypothetical protein